MSNSRRMRRTMAAAAARHGRLDLRPAGVAALVDGRLNAYKCPACRRYTVVLQLHRGATPSMLACRAAGDVDTCQGTAFSLFYPLAEAWPAGAPTTPGWEWYRPDEAELAQLRAGDAAGYQHVVQGGLLLRPYGAGRGHTPPAAVVTAEDLATPDVDPLDLATDATVRAVNEYFADEGAQR